MLKGLTPIPSYPPVSETRVLQSEMFSRPFGRQLDLRLVEAYTQDYDKGQTWRYLCLCRLCGLHI